MSGKKAKDEPDEQLTRIAIVDDQKCKPKKCAQECMKFCPVVRMGKLCVEVKPTDKISTISEELCIGCGICVKKCPFGAIQIINLPKNMEKQTTHRYGPNSFKIHRMPTPRPGQVLGLVGSNGTGKSTALKVLAGKLKPNLGRFENPPDWSEILAYFRGSELQNFFTRILEDTMKAIIKPQYVDHIPKAIKGVVGEILTQKNEHGARDYIIEILDLSNVIGRGVQDLSGGELQRFAIAVVAVQSADVYMSVLLRLPAPLLLPCRARSSLSCCSTVTCARPRRPRRPRVAATLLFTIAPRPPAQVRRALVVPRREAAHPRVQGDPVAAQAGQLRHRRRARPRRPRLPLRLHLRPLRPARCGRWGVACVAVRLL